MAVLFAKYQGTGNDFVMLDNLDGTYDDLAVDQIQLLCDRKIGVGADGLIKISKHNEYDFEVEYYNADGSQSFCGNGARCSVAFASTLDLLEKETTFMAIDGAHKAELLADGVVRLEMLPVETISRHGHDFVINTGSPHYIRFAANDDTTDVVTFGREIRYSDEFKEEGVNVNLVFDLGSNVIHVATYERGVEDETLSCGTGVTACALAYMSANENVLEVKVRTKGGNLKVNAEYDTANGKGGFTNIWLYGPTKSVFNGRIVI